MKLKLRKRSRQARVFSLRKLRSIAILMTMVPGLIAGPAAAQDEAEPSALEALQAQVEDLSRLAVRTQSHIMIDVEYHFSNLWFAVRNRQWDLASFYLRETDSHLGWMVRVRPVRGLRGGGTVDLEPFRQSIEQSGFAQLQTAIERRDGDAFDAAYRQTLGQCYACHQAAGLTWLEPHVPEAPQSALMLRPE